MISNTPSANVLKVNGGAPLPGGGAFGPASAITYDIVVHFQDQDQIFAGVTPANPRYPDAVDTISALPNAPVGFCNTLGGAVDFIIPEMVRIDQECV